MEYVKSGVLGDRKRIWIRCPRAISTAVMATTLQIEFPAWEVHNVQCFPGFYAMDMVKIRSNH